MGEALIALGVVTLLVVLMFRPRRSPMSRSAGWHVSLGVRRDKELGRYIVEERAYHSES
jgi:hypothetical protein